MESDEVWQSITDEFSAAIEKAESVVVQASERKRGYLQQLLMALLLDSYRTAVSMQTLAQQGLTDRRIPADSLGLLSRQILERAIFSSYIRKHASAEMVDRFRKTSALEWKRSWGRSAKKEVREAERLPVKQLPTYRQMAEDVGGELYDRYRQLSIICHPRGVHPYSVVEHASGLSPQQFFRRLVPDILGVTTDLLTILTRNFSESQSKEGAISDSSP